MFEKVNAGHPDKMADRLAGAVVDLVYERAGGLTRANPRVACEVMAGHGRVDVQIETSLGRLDLRADDLDPLIHRLFGERVEGNVLIAPQDAHLSDNQTHGLRCGDNGIFKGCPPTEEQRVLTAIAATMWERFKSDGKYLISDDTLTICQSKAWPLHLSECLSDFIYANGGYVDTMNVPADTDEQGRYSRLYTDRATVETFMLGDKMRTAIINPLGPWTGGINVDCGCTNRKLGSDMGDGVTGGGLMGKDLSKADVSVNIVCYLLAQRYGTQIEACCSIGDEEVTFNGYYSIYAYERNLPKLPITMAFADIVEQARLYILTDCGGSFEKFAEWGLIRPKDV